LITTYLPIRPHDLPKEWWDILGVDASKWDKLVLTIEISQPIRAEITQTRYFRGLYDGPSPEPDKEFDKV
jgi:hypothetical protein